MRLTYFGKHVELTSANMLIGLATGNTITTYELYATTWVCQFAKAETVLK